MVCLYPWCAEWLTSVSLQWRQNGRESVSSHQPQYCLLNRLFRRRFKKTSKLRVTGLCAGNSPGTGEFPAQMASNAENVSIWWCHHDVFACHIILFHRDKQSYWNSLPMKTETFNWLNWYNQHHDMMNWKYNDLFHHSCYKSGIKPSIKNIQSLMIDSIVNWFSSSVWQTSSEGLFKHLCAVVDNTSPSSPLVGHLITVTKQVIIDGELPWRSSSKSSFHRCLLFSF